MILYDFLAAPCPICLSTSLVYTCVAMDEHVSVKMHKQFITGQGIFIDTKQHTVHLLDNFQKLQIIKFCNYGHYEASIKNITLYQLGDEDRIIVPDNITYEELRMQVNIYHISNTSKERGSLIFRNEYNTNKTHIMTTNGWKIVPLIPLDRLNLTNVNETVSKLERYMMLA
jgi:hypothetical protein